MPRAVSDTRRKPPNTEQAVSAMQISAVIPLYNKAPYIGAALASVMGQTRRPDQVIVVDDGSSDDGAAIAGAVPGVTLIRQANAGVSAARNAGIAAAHGDLVAFLDADDLWRPELLAELERLAAAYPQAAMLCAGYRRFNRAGPCGEFVAATRAWADAIVPGFYAEWSRGSFTCTSSIAVRRAALLKLGGMFPVGDRLGEDQDLWFRLAEAAPVAHVAKVCAEYRIDAMNNSAGGVRDPLPCYLRLGQRVAAGAVPAHEVAGARRLLASHMINVARSRAAAGDRAGARSLLWTRQAAGNPAYWLRSLLAVR